MIRCFVALAVLLSASSARAWDVSLRLASETTFRGSSETSTAASRADRAQRASKSGGMGAQCVTDDDCSGYCDSGTCVDPAAVAQTPTAPVTRPLPGCADDQQCALGYACQDQRCVERTQPQLQQPVIIQQCSSGLQCAQGQSCVGGQCLSPPPSPPASSLQRRGSELYVRERAVQLRQDLALGEGPVISTLASMQGVSAATLGRAMRARRAELAAVMGDGSDPTWPRRFLLEVEASCVPGVRVSSR